MRRIRRWFPPVLDYEQVWDKVWGAAIRHLERRLQRQHNRRETNHPYINRDPPAPSQPGVMIRGLFSLSTRRGGSLIQGTRIRSHGYECHAGSEKRLA